MPFPDRVRDKLSPVLPQRWITMVQRAYNLCAGKYCARFGL